jgi:hypothetical protein
VSARLKQRSAAPPAIRAAAALLALAGATACRPPGPTTAPVVAQTTAAEPPPPLAGDGTDVEPTNWFERWFRPRPASPPRSTAQDVGPPPTELLRRDLAHVDVQLRVLMVRVPKSQRAAVEPLWAYVREDVLDAEVHRRLRENGIRVGLGRREWWGAMRDLLDQVQGREVREPDPIRLPPGFPLSLDLDESPRDQTLFYVNEEGTLTGQTWPASRNVLRLTGTLDPSIRERLRLDLIPEVRQKAGGLDWIRTPRGFTRQPKSDGRAFRAVAFGVALTNADILVLAPNAKADTYGILGGALLTDEGPDGHYDRIIMFRPDVSYGNGNGSNPTQ